MHKLKLSENDRPETILIMAAEFSDGIFKIINKKYPLIKNIVIFREDTIEIAK
jgi:hypothetical protein|tara:strand:- start:252 stop:410 length:159 start_codon:yes stop_codon:yes gene_type:complete